MLKVPRLAEISLSLTKKTQDERAGLTDGCNAATLNEHCNVVWSLTCASIVCSLQVKAAGLLDVEVVALRLYSGPLYSKYNRILRETLSSE